MVLQFDAKRLRLKDELDSAKSQAERNKLGQFGTPACLAKEIVEAAIYHLPKRAKIRFLEPGFGTGAFCSALLRVARKSRIDCIEGYEIDTSYTDAVSKLWTGSQLSLHVGDFTESTPPTSNSDRFNLLICNPPYVRHHHIPTEQKPRLQELARRYAGVHISQLAGLYCYFLLFSHEWMSDDGIAAWLIPSEFMDVNYGLGVKHYLLEKVTTLQIHRFDPDDVQFDDALVSSTVVLLKRTPPPAGHSIDFTFGGTLTKPSLSRSVPSAALRNETKWSRFPKKAQFNTTESQQPRLGDFFTIKRGLATGCNDFFVLTTEQAAQYQIPRQFLLPILPSPRYLTVDEIAADANGDPVLDTRHYLLSCGLPEEEVKSRFPQVWRYLQEGLEAGVHEGYLCRHRSPWYSQEERPPAPFVCTYMGRCGTKSGKPFRFILNHSNATAANVYLILYPKPAVAGRLKTRPSLLRPLWHAISSITDVSLLNEGRVYGGGLHKLEPKELANVPARRLANLLDSYGDVARGSI